MKFNTSKYNSHWQDKKLSELGVFQRGKSKHRPRNDSSLFEGGEYPLVQTGEVKGANLFIDKHVATYNEFGLLQSKLWPKDTLCITIAANIAETSMLAYPMCFPDSIVGFLADKNESSEIFMHYVFTYIRRSIQNSASGSIQDNINIEYLTGLRFKIPHKKYQDKIVDILSNLDKKIELNNKINTELEAMAKLIYDYWFVQFDFPDAFGKPYKSSGGKMVYNEALKREIPDGWDVSQLSSILKNNYSSIGKDDFFDEIEYLDTGSLTKNAIINTELINTAQDKVPSRAKRIIHKDDILYSTVRPNLCHYGIIKAPVKNMIASTGFVQLSSKVEIISNDFIYTFLTSSWVTARLHQIAALSVSAYPSISPNDILDLNIALPVNGSYMESINSKLESIYTKISLNQKENNKLAELRDWLLPMLMNGQVTVNESSPSAL